jgi:hypothetical protein
MSPTAATILGGGGDRGGDAGLVDEDVEGSEDTAEQAVKHDASSRSQGGRLCEQRMSNGHSATVA